MRPLIYYVRFLMILLIMITILSLPNKVLALDTNISLFNALDRKISNSINKVAAAFKSDLKPLKHAAKRIIKTNYSKAIIKIYSLERKADQQLAPLKSKIPLLNLKKEPSSRLIVKSGDFKYFENLLNSLSSKQYYVDDQGFVLDNSSAAEDLRKSQEYSIVIDNLIKANHTTYI